MRITRYIQPASRGFAPVLSFSRNSWTGLQSEIDRLFETALTDFASAPSARQFPVDLYEDKDHTYVRAELPGVNREDINVEMTEGYLTITAARKTPAAEGKGERSFSFSRSVSVPEAVQTDQVAAAYENGVLTVTLPKREEAKPKKITVAAK
jgi:HSP20 family protein